MKAYCCKTYARNCKKLGVLFPNASCSLPDLFLQCHNFVTLAINGPKPVKYHHLWALQKYAGIYKKLAHICFSNSCLSVCDDSQSKGQLRHYCKTVCADAHYLIGKRYHNSMLHAKW